MNCIADGCSQATRVRPARTGELKRRTVVDGGANNGQSKGDVNGMMKPQCLQDGQTLVVVHRKVGIGAVAQRGNKRAVGGEWPDNVHTLSAGCLARGSNDRLIFGAEMPAFAGVRI